MIGLRVPLVSLTLLSPAATAPVAGQTTSRLDATSSAQQQTEQITTLLSQITAAAQEIVAVVGELVEARVELNTLQSELAALPNTKEALAAREDAEKKIAAVERQIQELEAQLAQLEQNMASGEAELLKLQTGEMPGAAQEDLKEIRLKLAEAKGALEAYQKLDTEATPPDTSEGKQDQRSQAGSLQQKFDSLQEHLQRYKTTHGK